MRFVRVTLLQNMDSILTTFSAPMQAQAIKTMQKQAVDIRLGVRVTAIARDEITLCNVKTNAEEKMPYGLCLWSAGNAARPLVRGLVGAIPEQVELSKAANPAAVKLSVDPYLRVIGARDIIALGDCSKMLGAPLPPTAQVAGQQGAYVARMINRGYQPNTGGLNVDPGVDLSEADRAAALQLRPIDAARMSDQPRLTELDLLAYLTNDSTYAQAPPGVSYYRKPFEFLSLGLMAYIGNEKALVSAEVLDSSFDVAGSLAFLLWRSVYITKQARARLAARSTPPPASYGIAASSQHEGCSKGVSGLKSFLPVN
ncbi:NADH dehydrogenase [Monoraphidium neglectum]|uniref:NADH:ubiquinone reductase (non-electrogenic) n=1 Tax=Monoraphidium neglectum TaxID=145388 RepID=A0A0D2MZL7_9CHLO|nr:NADH dehydrogenase [Monoraphidium neglectum]KIZ07870.1 NADH dehydrogenase [Monoraphidium neglectum]|eukprot:XP_013906889.1 NADH dehydrogenase [Monoraphidium neglectum]